MTTTMRTTMTNQVIDERMLELAAITIDNALNPRQGALDQLAVEEYASHIDELPAMDVFELPDGTYLLASGFHRIAAHRYAGRSEARCLVHRGSREEAAEFADLDNLRHGIQLTRLEKRGVIKRELKRHPDWSDVRLALACYTTDKTVRSVREEMEAASEIPRLDVLTGADGIRRPRTVSRPAPRNEPDENQLAMADSPASPPAPASEGAGLTPPAPFTPSSSPQGRKKTIWASQEKMPPPVPQKLVGMTAAAKAKASTIVTVNINHESRMCLVSVGPWGQPPAAFRSVAFERLLDELSVLLAEHMPAQEAPASEAADVPEEAPEWLETL